MKQNCGEAKFDGIHGPDELALMRVLISDDGIPNIEDTEYPVGLCEDVYR
jgi:hypothetical protein